MQPLDQPIGPETKPTIYASLVSWWEGHRLYFNVGLTIAIFSGLWENGYLYFYTWRDLPTLAIVLLMMNFLYCTGMGLQSLLVYYGPKALASRAINYLTFIALLLLLGFYGYTIGQTVAPHLPGTSYF